jgi:hypothetical protein
MRPNRSYIDVLARELACHGIHHWRIDRKHHHPRLMFERDGKTTFLVMPASASDWRSVLNARSNLRRILDARRNPNANQGRR